MFYVKEEADQFEGSKNRFQRFKKRRRISLRRRSNKKKNSVNDGRETIQTFHRNLRKAVKLKRRSNSMPGNQKIDIYRIKPMMLQVTNRYGYRNLLPP
jgi:hypothetical protein